MAVMNAQRKAKAESIESLSLMLSQSELVVVARPMGLTVAEVTDLRRKLRAAGCGLKVAKNSLVLRALKDSKFSGIEGYFKGVTAIAYSTDPVAAVKVVNDYAKTNKKLEIVGAGMGDGKVLSEAEARTLASLPGINELRAKILGLLNAPATKVACILKAPAGQVARVISAYSQKG